LYDSKALLLSYRSLRFIDVISERFIEIFLTGKGDSTFIEIYNDAATLPVGSLDEDSIHETRIRAKILSRSDKD